MTTCEHTSLVGAAAQLGLAPSTLSARLKLIEEDLGVTLFQRHGSGLTPGDAAAWLYQASVPLLLLEAFAARTAATSPDQPMRLLKVSIDLRFAFGRISRGLNVAFLRTAREEPSLLVIPDWRDQEDPLCPALSVDADDFAEVVELQLGASFSRKPSATATSVMEEEWVLVGRQSALPALQEALEGSGVLMPALPRGLLQEAPSLLAERGVQQIVFVDTPPSDWKRLLLRHPDAVVALPASAVSARSSVMGLVSTSLNPPLRSSIIGTHENDAIAMRFLDRLRKALKSKTVSPGFRPVLTARRVRYFNLAHKLGQVSAAARAAHVAQPALSQQLHKLEESLDVTLFGRSSSGLRLLPSAARFAGLSSVLERQLQDLRSAGRSKDRQLSLGLTPCFARGEFAKAVAASLTELREAHGAEAMIIEQGHAKHLSGLLHEGRIGLAVVDVKFKKYPQLRMEWADRLILISHREHHPARNAVAPMVQLDQIEHLPMVLPTRESGVRQALERALRDKGLRVRPLYETDSFALTRQFMSQQRLFTISTPGTLDALGEGWVMHEISDPPIRVPALILYSSSRSLSELERTFVALLSQRLRGLVMAEDQVVREA